MIARCVCPKLSKQHITINLRLLSWILERAHKGGQKRDVTSASSCGMAIEDVECSSRREEAYYPYHAWVDSKSQASSLTYLRATPTLPDGDAVLSHNE